jgi:hypothetical protein
MVWGMKGTRSLLFSISHTLYRQRVSMVLQCAHVVSILKCVVAIGEGFYKLGILSGGPPLSLFDMLLRTRGAWELDVPLVVFFLS